MAQEFNPEAFRDITAPSVDQLTSGAEVPGIMATIKAKISAVLGVVDAVSPWAIGVATLAVMGHSAYAHAKQERIARPGTKFVDDAIKGAGKSLVQLGVATGAGALVGGAYVGVPVAVALHVRGVNKRRKNIENAMLTQEELDGYFSLEQIKALEEKFKVIEENLQEAIQKKEEAEKECSTDNTPKNRKKLDECKKIIGNIEKALKRTQSAIATMQSNRLKRDYLWDLYTQFRDNNPESEEHKTAKATLGKIPGFGDGTFLTLMKPLEIGRQKKKGKAPAPLGIPRVRLNLLNDHSPEGVKKESVIGKIIGGTRDAIINTFNLPAVPGEVDDLDSEELQKEAFFNALVRNTTAVNPKIHNNFGIPGWKKGTAEGFWKKGEAAKLILDSIKPGEDLSKREWAKDKKALGKMLEDQDLKDLFVGYLVGKKVGDYKNNWRNNNALIKKVIEHDDLQQKVAKKLVEELKDGEIRKILVHKAAGVFDKGQFRPYPEVQDLQFTIWLKDASENCLKALNALDDKSSVLSDIQDDDPNLNEVFSGIAKGDFNDDKVITKALLTISPQESADLVQLFNDDEHKEKILKILQEVYKDAAMFKIGTNRIRQEINQKITETLGKSGWFDKVKSGEAPKAILTGWLDNWLEDKSNLLSAIARLLFKKKT